MRTGLRLFYLFSLIIVVCSACSNKQKFDRKLWVDGDGISFPYRDNMLDNLLETHPFKGQKLKQVTDSLGRPEGSKKSSIYYDINIKWDGGYPPAYVKRLFIHYNADSVVIRTEVYEHTAEKKKK
ncbi:MAG: hypothetical protein EOP47_19625 [Sphingobacteriaceae bacterium]|nr:MAG: hypothetical protein EOP47_19625 [Sphingobacteriaceae bacterium]